jgi:hypothetical protein
MDRIQVPIMTDAGLLGVAVGLLHISNSKCADRIIAAIRPPELTPAEKAVARMNESFRTAPRPLEKPGYNYYRLAYRSADELPEPPSWPVDRNGKPLPRI